MNGHRTVVELATVAVVLAAGTNGLAATLSRARLVHATDSVRVGVLCRNKLLASISELLFIPLDRLKKAL